MSSDDSTDTRLHFQVKEYSPNCPKYINRREIVYDANNAKPVNKNAKRQERATLTESDQAFVQSMDTLWIGSYAPDIGADMHHRGGRPGFIRVTSSSTIEWPEYRGNGMFFTSGNLESHDRGGVTLVDFNILKALSSECGTLVIDPLGTGCTTKHTQIIRTNSRRRKGGVSFCNRL